MDLEQDRRRLDPVLELHPRVTNLEPSKLGRGLDPLLEGLVGCDDLFLGLLRYQHVPVRRAVGLDPAEHRGAFDQHRVRRNVLLRPLEVAARDADGVHLQQLVLVEVGLEAEVGELDAGVVDDQMGPILLEPDLVLELEVHYTAGELELEQVRDRAPHARELVVLEPEGPVQAKRLDHDIARDRQRSATGELHHDVVAALAIGDGGDFEQLDLAGADLPQQRLRPVVAVLEIDLGVDHLDVLQQRARQTTLFLLRLRLLLREVVHDLEHVDRPVLEPAQCDVGVFDRQLLERRGPAEQARHLRVRVQPVPRQQHRSGPVRDREPLDGQRQRERVAAHLLHRGLALHQLDRLLLDQALDDPRHHQEADQRVQHDRRDDRRSPAHQPPRTKPVRYRAHHASPSLSATEQSTARSAAGAVPMRSPAPPGRRGPAGGTGRFDFNATGGTSYPVSDRSATACPPPRPRPCPRWRRYRAPRGGSWPGSPACRWGTWASTSRTTSPRGAMPTLPGSAGRH